MRKEGGTGQFSGVASRVAKRDRLNKRGERELGVDTGGKCSCLTKRARDLLEKQGGADVFYERRLLQ